jgi:SAM-dependent methyltransferase
MNNQHWHNRGAWDRLAKTKNRLARPARDEDFANPLQSVDGPGWLGPDISNQKVLCLAAGGGRQGPLYAAAGADVTVVDLSPAMLELDAAVARQRNLNLRTIEASMDNLSILGDAVFDIVIHPVSTCYVPDVVPVYREVARLLRVGGIYISQHKQPTSLQAGLKRNAGAFPVRYPYYSREPLPPEPCGNLVREEGMLEYVHRWEDLLGAMCRSGLVIEDLTEPMHAQADAAEDSFELRCQFIAPYVRVKARRVERSVETRREQIWQGDP